jgi:hypothetical protein
MCQTLCLAKESLTEMGVLKPNLRPYIALQHCRTWLVKRLKAKAKSRLCRDFKRFNSQVQAC